MPECAGIRRRPEVMISTSVSTRSYEVLSAFRETPSFVVAVIAIVFCFRERESDGFVFFFGGGFN